MTVIYKYPILGDRTGYSEFEIDMPFDAELIGIQEIDDIAYIYALVNTECINQKRRFCIVCTGTPIANPYRMSYIGRFTSGALVYHLLEILH